MLHPQTFAFLHDLSVHNDREWFALNRERYVAAKTDAESFFDRVREGLVPVMPGLEEVRARELMYRLMVRWSKGRLPYKTHFSAYFHPAGRKSALPGYYMRITPGGSFVAAGLWEPSPAHLAAVHGEIDFALRGWLEIVEGKAFRKTFSPQGDRAAKVPKGYAPDHPAAPWLVQKSFVVQHPLPDDLLENKNAAQYCIGVLKKAGPLVEFLTRALEG